MEEMRQTAPMEGAGRIIATGQEAKKEILANRAREFNMEISDDAAERRVPPRQEFSGPWLARAALTVATIVVVAFIVVLIRFLAFEFVAQRTKAAAGRDVAIVGRDGRFDLAVAGGDRYWLPSGNRDALVTMIVELRLNAYRTDACDVQPGDVVLDCGANVGVFTRYALKRGAHRVVAIEPAPENLACLRRSFEREIRQGSVVVYAKGVWDHDAELNFKVVNGDSRLDTAVLDVPGAREGARITVTTIDKIVAELRLGRVDFVKMDIEGAECRALRGAVATIRRYHPRMAISGEHATSPPEQVIKAVEEIWPGVRIGRFPPALVRAAQALKRESDDQTVFAW
jgi:FkbM family methyltransferase